MNKIKIAVSAALGMISLAVSSYGQVTINMSDGDMLLGFRTANAPGNTLNLEVDLGSYTQFTLMDGGSFFLPQLSVLDLQGTYGAGTAWQRSDLMWSIATSSFNPVPGLPDQSLFETSVSNGNPSTIFKRQTATFQQTAAQNMDGAIGGLNGSTSTVNSNFAALIPTSGNSYDFNIQTSGMFTRPWNATSTSLMTFANVENNTAIPTGGFVSSDLYELLPTTSGTQNGVKLGTFELFGNGTLEFISVIPEPSTYRMLALGGALLCGLMILRRRRSVRS
jgi:hypothetical protein